MLFGIRMSCQRQEKVGISWNTYRNPFLCYSKCWWFGSTTPVVQQLWLVHNMRLRYSSDFAIPSKSVREVPSRFTHVFGNQWATSLWKLRHLGKLVFGYVTEKLVIYRNTEILLTCLLSVKNTLFKQIREFVRNSGKEYVAELRWGQQGQQGKKLTGRPETWKGHITFIWDLHLHCDTSTVMPLNNLLNELRWSTISHFILVRVWHQSLSCSPFDFVPAGLPWRTWTSSGSTGTNWRGILDPSGRLRVESPSGPWECSAVEE